MNAPVLPTLPLLAEVRQIISAARQRVAIAVNAELAKQLAAEFGKGWSERQLRYCLRIAEIFPDAKILHTLCSELSRSIELARAKLNRQENQGNTP